MPGIVLNPVGIVHNSINEPEEMPFGGVDAVIEILPSFVEGLLTIGENSHLWVLGWFHKSSRQVLQTTPGRVNPSLPPRGVFGLRSPNRPNPIGLSLARLDRVEENFLHVKGLDVINKTPVLDIKPYIENDTVFSPLTPYLKAESREARHFYLSRLARNHHQEECKDFHIAVRMALIAQEAFGHLNAGDLLLTVTGSPCLADCLQGISRARLANPPRLKYREEAGQAHSLWQRGRYWIDIRALDPAGGVGNVDLSNDHLLFAIKSDPESRQV